MKLTAQKRDIFKKKVAELRAGGLVPAEIYGHGFENAHITVSHKEMVNLLKKGFAESVIQLEYEGSVIPVLIQDIDRDILGDVIHHIDFHAVKMDEKINAEITVHIVGESPAVKEKGGVLIKVLDKIEIEAFPNDIPQHIEVSVDGLVELGDSIHAGAIVLPKGVKLITDTDAVVVSITEQAPEEPQEAPAAPAEGEASPAEPAQEGK